MSMPKIAVFVGSGGVGKSTISAAYALAAASQGSKVALLTVDPAERIKQILYAEHTDHLIPFHQGLIYVSFFEFDKLLHTLFQGRHILIQDLLQFLENVFSSSDLLGAFRLFDWFQQHPDCDLFVLDTAPEIHALDFLFKQNLLEDILFNPLLQKLISKILSPSSSFKKLFTPMQSPLIKFFQWLVGSDLVLQILRWISATQPLLQDLIRYREYVLSLLQSSSTSFFYVSSTTRTDLDFFSFFQIHLKKHDLHIKHIILNQTIPHEAQNCMPDLPEPFLSYFQTELKNRLNNQDNMTHLAKELGYSIHCVPSIPYSLTPLSILDARQQLATIGLPLLSIKDSL